MGTISDKLMRIINTKEDIRQALISKGYDVPTSIPFKEYAKMILDLPCNADSFPDIEGIVARYSASGLTNEEMSKNPVWKDLMGNGHDLQMKNFGWGGMSGVGGYVQNFNDFRNNSIVDKVRIDEQNSNSIKVTILNTEINNAIYIPKDIYQFNKSYSIKISSEGYNEGDLFLLFYVPSTSTATTVKVPLNPNGITEIPAIKEDDFLAVYINVSGKVGSFTIEQLPLYPGALVFDGVDDYGTCDNFPVMTKEKGYTVVVLRQWISTPTRYTALVSKLNISTDGSFVFEEYNNGWLCGSFGKYTEAITVNNNNPISWQTSKSYNGESINVGTSNDTDVLSLGKLYHSNNQGGFANIALYSLVILDHDATEEELTKIKDYFVKTYPWLFPDQAWTVVGKTNEDEDRATIANITGNGNDLVLSNFGFAEGSGYGLYKTPFELYPSVQHSSKYSLSFSKFALGDHNLIIAPKQNDLSYDIKVKVTGLKDGVKFKWGWIGTTGYIDITTDGIHMLNKPASQIRQLIVEFAEDFDPDHVVTIEQIPEYEGYLVTDGVDDKVESSPFTINKDWTIVGNWTMLSNIPSNCGIIKVSSTFLYNSLDGGTIYFAGGPIKIQSKSINAFCSDGRIYLNDWTEILKPDVQIASGGNKSSLNIASYSANFTKMAFKNLAIYEGKTFSKDDCIKAYNYLQTLKAK
jgi:hypothetical protein